MLSIGELAHRTGVSRRMLRHWDEFGLLKPWAVDERSGYRRYAPSQADRVHAIAALRAVGFGLQEVKDLLSSQLTDDRLRELLHAREQELATRIDEASAHLTEVRQRLRSLERGRNVTMRTLELGPLPPLRLAGLQAHVIDESEIGGAVHELLPDLRRRLASHDLTDTDVLLTYYGPPGDVPIEVRVGVEATDELAALLDLTILEVPGADRGVTVQYDDAPGGVGDAWIMLDAALEKYELQMTGVYRQIVRADGPVRLQAPVAPSSASC